jgi:hypothetical protein
MSVVWVRWIDSNTFNGWQQPKDVLPLMADPEHMHCESVGFLFHEDEKQLVLAGDQSDSGAVGELMCIPQVAVVERRVIRK